MWKPKYNLPLRVSIDEETYEQLVRMCEQENITFSKATRLILRFYFQRVRYEDRKTDFDHQL